MASNRPLSHLINNSNNSNRSSTSLITPALQTIADPPKAQVDAHLFDLLTSEVMRAMEQSEQVARRRALEQQKLVQQDLNAQGLGSGVPLAGAVPDGQSGEEGVRSRLDAMGYSVGWTLSERLSLDRPRLPSAAPVASAPPQPPTPEVLEAVKFICKDVWIALYDKQIDNLRTNHRGVYVLHDNAFRPIGRLSGEADEVAKRVKFFLAFPCGVIRGALANLGVSSTVSAESAGLPAVTLQIKSIKPGAV